MQSVECNAANVDRVTLFVEVIGKADGSYRRGRGGVGW